MTFLVHVVTEFKEAFAKFSRYRINTMGVKYDYHSIMHYGMKAFSKNGYYTILPKQKGIFSLGNDRLSPLDIKQTNLLYKCDSKLLCTTNCSNSYALTKPTTQATLP